MSATAMLIFDILLAVSLLSLASAAVATRDARRSVIFFMAFGLVLAVAWGRLLAPDVALAEAAIGAGLSGALLLAAVREQPRRTSSAGGNSADSRHATGVTAALKWLVTLFCAALSAMLAWALLKALDSGPNDPLALMVRENLPASGVSNPVTAVLLNFRAYDTLLELAVLLAALLGILALLPARPAYQAAGPVFDGLARWLVPALILTAGYLLWVGAHAPGGAFQAGATLAAAGVVLRLAGRRHAGLPQGRALHLAIAAGVGMFVLVGVSLLLMGRPFLGYPPAWAGSLILLIESAAMLAIAATLVLAFLGGRPRPAGIRAGNAEPATLSPQIPAGGSGHVRSGDDRCTAEPAERPGTENKGC